MSLKNYSTAPSDETKEHGCTGRFAYPLLVDQVKEKENKGLNSTCDRKED
jgi:hypothetical protein